MDNRYCWHCGVFAEMKLPNEDMPRLGYPAGYTPGASEFSFPRDETGSFTDDFVFVIYVCNYCGYPNIAKYETDEIDSSDIEYLHDPVEWVPLRAEDHTFVDVPKRVASAANEAFRCFSIQAYRASVIMARSVLEGIANEKIHAPFKTNSKGEEIDKDLKEKIKNMKEEGIISKKLGDKTSVIRDIGNGSAHNIFHEISKDDASATLGFLDLVIQEVYTQEAQLKKLGKTSEEIKREKEESRKQ